MIFLQGSICLLLLKCAFAQDMTALDLIKGEVKKDLKALGIATGFELVDKLLLPSLDALLDDGDDAGMSGAYRLFKSTYKVIVDWIGRLTCLPLQCYLGPELLISNNVEVFDRIASWWQYEDRCIKTLGLPLSQIDKTEDKKLLLRKKFLDLFQKHVVSDFYELQSKIPKGEY